LAPEFAGSKARGLAGVITPLAAENAPPAAEQGRGELHEAQQRVVTMLATKRFKRDFRDGKESSGRDL
jgi:hypothetical protein